MARWSIRLSSRNRGNPFIDDPLICVAHELGIDLSELTNDEKQSVYIDLSDIAFRCTDEFITWLNNLKQMIDERRRSRNNYIIGKVR